MRFYTDSETRARHAFIDATLENTVEQLNNPAATAYMAKDAVDLHHFITNLLYVANLRHGRLQLPKKIADDRVPVLALQPGERVEGDPRIGLQTPIQSKISIPSVRGWMNGDEKQATDLLARIGPHGEPQDGPIIIEGTQTSKAFVHTVSRRVFIESPKMGKNIFRHFSARPVMALMYTPGQTRVTPSTLIHENEHVGQRLFVPIQRLDSQEDAWRLSLRNELEAYAGMLSFMTGLVRSGYQPAANEDLDYSFDERGQAVSHVQVIDDLRRETNVGRKDKFFPNGTLRKALGQAGLDNIYTA